MPIKFKGDMQKVVAKNKGDMSKISARQRIVQAIASNPSSVSITKKYTKMLMHFNDTGVVATWIGGNNYGPAQGVLSPDGTKAYIGSWSPYAQQGVYVIDVATNTKVNTISTSLTTLHVTINSTGTRIYATGYGATSSSNTGDKLYIIDPVGGSILHTVTAGGGCHSSAITPNDKFLFVACETAGLYRIDLSATTPVATFLGNATWGMYAPIVSSDGTKLYVSTGSTVKVYSLNQTTGAITLSNTLTGFSGAYTAAKTNTSAYYLNFSSKSVTPIPFSTSNKRPNIALSEAPYGASVSPDGSRLYISICGDSSISAIRTSDDQLIANLSGGLLGPRGVVATNNKLFVSSHMNDGIRVWTLNDSLTFSDDSQSPLAQYRAGASTSSTQSKFGGKSLALTGTSKLQFANTRRKQIDLLDKPFCVEGWFYLTGYTAGVNAGLMSFANSDSGDCQGLHIDIDTSGKLVVYLSTNGTSWDLGGPSITSTTTPALNSWFHIALIRETTGGDIKLVYNGTVIGTKSTTASLYTGDYFYIGRTLYLSSTKIDGYVDDVRIVVGSCPYSASAFVVPTAQLTDIADTKLLINGNDKIEDSSSLGLYVGTFNAGNYVGLGTEVQSKFGGSSIKISSTDWTYGFIRVKSNNTPIAFENRAFTIEGWFWLNANNVGYQPLIMMATSTDSIGPSIMIDSNNTLTAQYGSGNNITTTCTPSANSWHHIALVREYASGPIRLYCDGILIGSVGSSGEIYTSENIWIGHYPYFASAPVVRTLNGYVDEVRITTDYAAYTGNFNPSTTAYASVTSPGSLLHFEGTNGSTTITDSSSSPKTFTTYGTGTAISTAKSKFGSSSMYFPGGIGTGTRVTATSSDFMISGDFTIEYWANMSSMSAGLAGSRYNTMVRLTDSTNTLLISTKQDNRLFLTIPGSSITCGTPIPLGKWTHIALSRRNNDWYVYLNGVLDGRGTSAGTFSQGNLMLGNEVGVDGVAFNGYIDEFRFTKGTALYYPKIAPTTKLGLVEEPATNQVTTFGRTFEISDPSSTATGIPTMDVVSEGINFWTPNGGGNMKNSLFAKDLSNTKTANQAKTVIASFKYPNSNFSSISTAAAVAFKDPITGRILGFYNSTWPGNPTQWGYWQYTCDSSGAPSNTTGGSFTRVGNDVVATLNTNFWIKLVDDGTNYITGYYSYDVTNPSWTQAFQVARTGWLTNGSGEIGVISNSDSYGDGNVILTSWSVT